MSENSNQNENGSGNNETPRRLSDDDMSTNENVDHAKGNGSGLSPADGEIALRAEADKFKNEYLYLRAEFDNYKKQVIKERSDLRKYGSERMVVELLNVLDLLEKALETKVTQDNLETFLKGVQLTATEFKNTLQRQSVEELPAQGIAFDPMLHEALTSEETDSVAPGYISKVFKKPYKLHDRVIRHGQVVVAKAKPAST